MDPNVESHLCQGKNDDLLPATDQPLNPESCISMASEEPVSEKMENHQAIIDQCVGTNNKEGEIVTNDGKIKIKQEPLEMKIKEEPIDIEDYCAAHKNKTQIEIDDDDDDCIIVMETVPLKKKQSKVDCDVVVIISDDEEGNTGEESSTSTQVQTAKESNDPKHLEDPSISEHNQKNQEIAVNDANSQNLLDPNNKDASLTRKDAGEIQDEAASPLPGAAFVNRVEAHPNKEITGEGILAAPTESKDDSHHNMEEESEIVNLGSPAKSDSSDKEMEDEPSETNYGWIDDVPEDNMPNPSVTDEGAQVDVADSTMKTAEQNLAVSMLNPGSMKESEPTDVSNMHEEDSLNDTNDPVDENESTCISEHEEGTLKDLCEPIEDRPMSNVLTEPTEDNSDDAFPNFGPTEENGEDDITSREPLEKENLYEDNLPTPEPVDEDEPAEDETEGLEDEMEKDYDSDGWLVDSDEEANGSSPVKEQKDKDFTGTNLETRQDDAITTPTPVEIIPARSPEQSLEQSPGPTAGQSPDSSSRQEHSDPLPLGIFPVGLEPTVTIDCLRPPNASTENDGHQVFGVGRPPLPSPEEPTGIEMNPDEIDQVITKVIKNHLFLTEKSDSSKNQSKNSLADSIRSQVTKGKLRSSSRLLKDMKDSKSPKKMYVNKNLPDVVRGNSQADAPVFNCHLCFNSFRDKKSLEKHLANHPQVTRIMCKYCNTSFEKKRSLQIHLKRCYSRKKRKSPIKKEKDGSSGIPDQPSSRSNERRKIDFSSVKKEPTDTKSKREIPPNKEEHKCKICHKVFSSWQGWRVHQGVVHAEAWKKAEALKKAEKLKKAENLKKVEARKKAESLKKAENLQKTETAKKAEKKRSRTEQNTAEVGSSMRWKNHVTVWICPYCHGSFTSRKRLKRHMYLTHNVTGASDLQTLPKDEAARMIYYCSTCKESFRSQYIFDRHPKSKKSRKKCEKRFQCNLCFKYFEKKVQCASHIQEHLGPVESRKKKERPNEHQSNQKNTKASSKYKCKYCEKTFAYKYMCAKHELTHTDSEPWHCYVCFKIFYLDSSIVAHMENMHKGVCYCKKCYCIIKNKGKNLCIDCDKRRKGDSLKCSICKTEFGNPTDLTHHILAHTEEGSAKDSAMKASKSSAVVLDSAFQKAKRKSTTVSPPPNPSKTFNKTTAVKEIFHVTRSHKKALLFSVPSVDTIPRNSGQKRTQNTPPTDLNPPKRPKAIPKPKQHVHMTRSSDRRLPSISPNSNKLCMKCGDQDISFEELNKHARSHLDVKSRFQCNACQQCFLTMYDIEEHGCSSSQDTGASCSYTVSNMVYQCKFCSREFLNVMEARKHVLSTNKACLFECTECKAEYTRQGDLMVHLVSVHGQYLECDKCSAQFTRKIDLDNHIKQHEDMSH